MSAVCLVLGSSSLAAKNDIRDISLGQPIADALETFELEQAKCSERGAASLVCAYDDNTSMTVFYTISSPHNVEKIIYQFKFGDPTKVKQRLSQLYNLKANHIEGDHKLSAHETLTVDLSAGGVGTLSITGSGTHTAERPRP